jgi:hypothetical protein
MATKQTRAAGLDASGPGLLRFARNDGARDPIVMKPVTTIGFI